MINLLKKVLCRLGFHYQDITVKQIANKLVKHRFCRRCGKKLRY